MEYPKLLIPNGIEPIKLPSGKLVDVPKTMPVFRRWIGPPVDDSYGNKPILEYKGLPVFAEIHILRLFREAGWNGVWVDTYRGKFRTEYWPKNEVQLPSGEMQILERIFEKAGSNKGCFDVFCWKDGLYIWVESKLRGHDHIKASQITWLHALEFGLPLSSFLIQTVCSLLPDRPP